MNIANKISTFRILSVPFFVASLVYFHQDPAHNDHLRFIALAIFVLAVISDAVDGYIARKAREESPAGKILDPLGDKLLLMSAFLGLYLVDLPVRFPLAVILVVISRDLIILLGAIVLFMVRQKITIVPTRWGKLTTTFQMAAVIAVLLQWHYAFALWRTAVFFTIVSGIDYVIRGFKLLYALDTSRHHP